MLSFAAAANCYGEDYSSKCLWEQGVVLGGLVTDMVCNGRVKVRFWHWGRINVVQGRTVGLDYLSGGFCVTLLLVGFLLLLLLLLPPPLCSVRKYLMK
jgi:hypothetical protein